MTERSAQENVTAPARRDWISLAVLSVGLGIIVLNGTIVGVALPSIITDLQLNLTQAQWANSLYAVLLAALLLSTGKLADTWGRKRAFLAGLTIFVAGSVLAGFSTSAATLISARAVQAIGAAFIMSSMLSTVNAVFRGKYRAAAFGVRSAVISKAAAVGPLVGGALTEWVSWYSRLSRAPTWAGGSPNPHSASLAGRGQKTRPFCRFRWRSRFRPWASRRQPWQSVHSSPVQQPAVSRHGTGRLGQWCRP